MLRGLVYSPLGLTSILPCSTSFSDRLQLGYLLPVSSLGGERLSNAGRPTAPRFQKAGLVRNREKSHPPRHLC